MQGGKMSENIYLQIPIIDKDLEYRELNLIEVFKNAENIKSIACEQKHQEFTLLRFLLSIMHTVYSRVDFYGNPYDEVEIDDEFLPLYNEIDEGELEDYIDSLEETWIKLWENQSFVDKNGKSPILNYLKIHEEKFGLFGDHNLVLNLPDSYRKDDFLKSGVKTASATKVNLNKINKARFKADSSTNIFNDISLAETNFINKNNLLRYLIAQQQYPADTNKTYYDAPLYNWENDKGKWKVGYRNAKGHGWCYSLGGTYFEGDNLFETLMLNFALVHPIESFNLYRQEPIWEKISKEYFDDLLKGHKPKSLAELYTFPARSLYLDEDFDLDTFEPEMACLPKLDKTNANLEVLTRWNYDAKNDINSPQIYTEDQPMWKDFSSSLKSLESKGSQWGVGILDNIRRFNKYINNSTLRIQAISLEEYDSNSKKPKNENFASISARPNILIDDGWNIVISSIIDKTTKVIDKNFCKFLKDFYLAKGQKDITKLITKEKRRIYFDLNEFFSNWISNIKEDDSKEEKRDEWFEILFLLLRTRGDELIKLNQSYRNIKSAEGTKNIIEVYNEFIYKLKKELNI